MDGSKLHHSKGKKSLKDTAEVLMKKSLGISLEEATLCWPKRDRLNRIRYDYSNFNLYSVLCIIENGRVVGRQKGLHSVSF